MDKEHRVSVYDMVKELNLKEVTPEINSKEVYIEQAEINRPALQLAVIGGCNQRMNWKR